MQDLLKIIQKNIKDSKYPNESAVSNGIVLPILEALGWPRLDPSIVYPEYPLKGRKVDFALLHRNRPKVVIEVKKIDNLKKADKQLFEYAYHAGCGIAVLTDGKEWHFYYPISTGSYDDRKFDSIHLLERATDENIEKFNNYLSYEEVISKNALKNAERVYKDQVRSVEAFETIPEAWEKLINDKNEVIVDALVEKVQEVCGGIPSEEMVVQFLFSLHSKDFNLEVIPDKISKKVISNKYFIDLPKTGVKGSAVFLGKEMKVLKGSTFTRELSAKCPESVRKARRMVIRKGIVKKKGAKYHFIKDYTFPSPSQACSVLFGFSASGNIYWKSKESKPLGDFR